MRTETLKVPTMKNDQDTKATVSVDESVASTRRPKAAVEDLGFDVAKPVHGEGGECCGGCGG